MLIVEDGTRPAGANSFCDVAAADAYLVPRGLWPAGNETGTQKESALLRAVDWLNALPWKGRKADFRHPLCWPRVDVLTEGQPVPMDEVPPQVAQSQAEMAAMVFRGVDVLAPIETGVTSVTEASSEGLDVLSESKSRSVGYGQQGGDTFYTAATNPIIPLLRFTPGRRGGGGCVALERG